MWKMSSPGTMLVSLALIPSAKHRAHVVQIMNNKENEFVTEHLFYPTLLLQFSLF